jgi:outer membrane protein TolC
VALVSSSFVLALLAGGGLAPHQGGAESVRLGADDPVLEALIAEALERNPEVKASREATLAAHQGPAQAGSLPDPMVAVLYTNEGWSPSLGTMEDTTLAFMVRQGLPFPGKRRLRAEWASRQAALSEQRERRVRLGVVAQVQRAYYGLVLARDLAALTREQEQIWQQIEGVARARYAVGQGAQQDVLRVQIEVTRIGQLRAERGAEAEIRRAELHRLLDRPVDAPVETEARLALRKLEGTDEELVAGLQAASPELQSAAIAIELEGLGVELAGKEFKPDFSVQAAYMHRGGLDPMWQAGIGVSVPAYRKRLSAGRAEAEARRRSAERNAESLRLRLRFRTQERLAQLRAAEQIAELFAKGIIPQDRLSFESGLAGYQVGKIPFIAVLEALATLYGDRASQLRLLADHARGRASLEEGSLEAGPAMLFGAEGALGPAPGSLGSGGAMSRGAAGSMSEQ